MVWGSPGLKGRAYLPGRLLNDQSPLGLNVMTIRWRSISRLSGELLICATVWAIRLHPPGRPDDLVYEEIETPSPGAGEVLVRVHAAAITRDELNWPVDRLPAVPSYELSGVVVGLGPAVVGFEVGDSVFGLTGFERDGAAAEQVTVPAHLLASKPNTLTHVEAAALPLAGLSAWQGLFDHGHLEKGQRVLVHGGGGGVGSFAVQLARLHGAHVIATASGPRVRLARDLGADEVVDVGSADFTAIEPVSLVFDSVGADRLVRSASVVHPGGRIVSVAERPRPDFGSDRGVATTFFIVEPNAGQLRQLGRLADDGSIRVLVDSTFQLHRARDAFERLRGGGTEGKVVFVIGD